VSFTAGGDDDPTLSLNNGATAVYTGLSGATLDFAYVVQSTDVSPDLIATAFNLPADSTLRDTSGFNADLSGFTPINTELELGPIPNAPAIVNEAATPSAGSQLGAGQTVEFDVTFSSPVTVTVPDFGGGDPFLDLSNGATASYAGASGATLSFDYVVQPGDVVSDLEALDFNLPGFTEINDAYDQEADLSGFTPIDTGVALDAVAC
jgi:hypothetical protein